MSYHGPINPIRPPPNGEASIIIYGYVPSLGLAALAVALFSAAAIVHAWWFVKGRGERRARKSGKARGTGWGVRTFEGLVVLGCLMEIVGYAFRIYSNRRPFLVTSFVVQYFMIVCAPVAFSAALYLGLQYALSANPANQRVLPIRPRLFVGSFVTIDVATTILQIAGAALIGVSESARVQGNGSAITPEQANDILLAGLALQSASFFVFLGLLTYVIVRVVRARSLARRNGTHGLGGAAPATNRVDSDSTLHANATAHADAPAGTAAHAVREKPANATATTTPRKGGFLSEHGIEGHTLGMPFLAVLYLTSGMLFMRTVFRLAETAEGIFGYASTHEYLFGIFEFAPVILSILIWGAFPVKSYIDRMIVRREAMGV